jgi:hypothetical protein
MATGAAAMAARDAAAQSRDTSREAGVEADEAAPVDPAPPDPARARAIGGGPAALAIARRALGAAMGADGLALLENADDDNAPAVLLAMAAPDCAADDSCADALWSEPLIQAAFAVHVPAAAPTPTSLEGLRVCLGGAEARALAPTQGTGAYVGADAAACLRDLAQGRAGAAVSLAYSADAALAGEVEPAAVREIFALSFAAPLRATAARGDAEAAAVIAALDDGLARLRAEGLWFDAVAEGFADDR